MGRNYVLKRINAKNLGIETKVICGNLHYKLKCVRCGGMCWTQSTDIERYTCNECGPSDIAHANQPKSKYINVKPSHAPE